MFSSRHLSFRSMLSFQRWSRRSVGVPTPSLLRASLVAAFIPLASSAVAQTATAPGVLELDPFDVTAGDTKGYQATNTISGTAMNTPLKDVPMTINVITSELLSDMS